MKKITSLLIVFSFIFFHLVIPVPVIAATQIDISGPVGSERFGHQVVALPNGNIVVTDPLYDAAGPIVNVGAVYLYNGATQALISTLTGNSANDRVGSHGVTALTNGNYVVSSPDWGEGDYGAVTWAGATSGVAGVISPSNSLIGSRVGDLVGEGGILALTNGNYVFTSPRWDRLPPFVPDAGAVTWGNGTTGTSGVVSSSNSLVGSAEDDFGAGGVTGLTNGNYVVSSYQWGESDVGAVTWGNGASGASGPVSASNSLVGSTPNDLVGSHGVTVLSNGNYVVSSGAWDGTATDVGAVSWGSGTSGVVGVVSSSNSLVGSTAFDRVAGATALANGNYVVGSSGWDGSAPNVGAATWGDGTIGVSGIVSDSNSLVGSTANDFVGESVTALTNGNYVLHIPSWGPSDFGASTWGDGTSGVVGTVSSSNSLVGSTANDRVGSSVKALTNGNYVVLSHLWGASDFGAVTWADGTTGAFGTVSASNSLVGSTASDSVGFGGVTALTNGNYVVSSHEWGASDFGAVTWADGATGVFGAVSDSNSLVGSTANDLVGNGGVTALTNGNYVVRNYFWGVADLGAVTWSSGTSGITGPVSSSNSLVGSTANDLVGGGGITALTNGNYVVISYRWGASDFGALTWGSGSSGITGVVSSSNSLVGSTPDDLVGEGGITTLINGNYAVRVPKLGASDSGAISYGSGSGSGGTVGTLNVNNSVLGTTANGGSEMVFSFDTANNQLVVGRPFDNIVTLFRPTGPTAANVSVSGRAMTADGTGLKDATVTLTDRDGNSRNALTSAFGYYRFEGVPAGGTYVLSARSKRFQFSPRIVSVLDDLTGADLIAEQSE